MKDTDFISMLHKAVDVNTTYMWGTFGAPVTQSLINTKTGQYPSWYTASKRTYLARFIGKSTFAFDCIGLIKGILWGWNANLSKTQGGGVYGSNGVVDTNANGFFKNLCTKQSSNFSNIIPGEAVWMNGHIGVYIGGGKVIECTPAWNGGVQISACGNIGAISGFNTRRWTSHGLIPYIEYARTEVISPNEPTVQADALNVREGAGVNFRVLTTLKKGDVVKVLGTSGEWSQIAAWVSTKYLSIPPLKGRVESGADNLNIRSGPGTSYPIVDKAQTGDIVTLIEKSGDWYKIAPDKYVNANFIILL